MSAAIATPIANSTRANKPSRSSRKNKNHAADISAESNNSTPTKSVRRSRKPDSKQSSEHKLSKEKQSTVKPMNMENMFAPTPAFSGKPNQVLTIDKLKDIATPIRFNGDGSRYAGPTFHSSPAPNAIPVPKFISSSVPTSSDIFFSEKISLSSASSVSTSRASSAPTSPSEGHARARKINNQAIADAIKADLFGKSSPVDKELAPSVQRLFSSDKKSESISTGDLTPSIERLQLSDATDTLGTSNVEAQNSASHLLTTSAKPTSSRPSRLGDSVLFRPRRNKGIASDSPASSVEVESPQSGTSASSSVIDLTAEHNSSRRAPSDFDFLFKPKGQENSDSEITASPRRAPRDFDFLFQKPSTPLRVAQTTPVR
ncbi:uncharacterized protein V1516DRAFT_361930 [Lipomyces oligophaga]|uniref:uncharacterized protein n=1 Tax=Lipomyces oligophaga TaxID=45792 RepID=UPI0034CD3BD0